MCGIVGAMSAWLGNPEKERVKELLTVSNLRGFQGAGAIVTDNKGQVSTFKTTDTGTHLAHDDAFNERLYHTKPLQNVACIIGHTRWPTKGAVTLEATHPHEYDGIIGVHNGTIDEINGKYIGKDQSDSFELFKSFSENGVRETIQRTRGAYALVWVDTRNNTINFLRNEKRPLYLAVMGAGGVMYWASERGMLDFVLGRQQGKFEVLNLLPNKWSCYKFPLRHGLGHDGIEELHGMAAPEVAAFSPFLGTRHWTGRHSTVGNGTSTPIAEAKEGGTKEESVASGTTKTSGSSTVVPMLPKPQTQSTWMPGGADKPKLKWCDTALTWVPAEPDPVTTVPVIQNQPPLLSAPEALSIPRTQTPTSPGGSPTKSNVERKESQSTEDTFRGDVLPDDGQVGGEEAVTPERDFSQGPQNISEVMQELFNESNTLYPGYRMTIEDNWMDEQYYIKCLQDGCLWCGDPQPDVATNLWTDVEEFMCIDCQGEEFARDYIKITLGISDEAIPVPLRKTA